VSSGTSSPIGDLVSPRGSIVDQFSSPKDGLLRKTTSVCS
jgi:hypothetical protein